MSPPPPRLLPHITLLWPQPIETQWPLQAGMTMGKMMLNDNKINGHESTNNVSAGKPSTYSC